MRLGWLAALALVVTGPPRASFEVTHLPRLALLLVLAAALSFALRRKTLALDAIDLLGLVVVGAMAVSCTLAVSPAYALRPMLLVVGVLTVAFVVREERHRWHWLGWLGLGVGVIAVLGLIEAVGLWHFFSLRGRSPASVMGQRNALAHVLVLGAPLVWALACKASPRRIVWVVTAAVLAFVIVATRCRAAWIAGPISLAVLSAFAARDASTRSTLVVLFGVTAGAVAAAGLLPVALDWTSPTPYADTARTLLEAGSGSGAGRLEQWRASLILFAERPIFGAGPGNWFVISGAEGHFANSDLIGLLVERGVVGLVTVLALAAAVLRAWWQQPRTVDALPLVAATAAALAVVATLDAVTQLPAGLLLVGLLFSAGLPRGRPRWQLSGSAVGPALAAVLLLAAVGTGLSFASRLYSSAAATPFDVLERAARLDPLDGELRLTLGEAYVSAHRCDDARPHLAAARRLLPLNRRGEELFVACSD